MQCTSPWRTRYDGVAQTTNQRGSPERKAIHIGPAVASQSYLSIETLVNAAKKTGAAAVHPGYGFLSENAMFADAVTKSGLIFVGPPADAIRAMGSKSGSKHIMKKAGVPCTPGYEGEDQTMERFIKEAKDIGFPLMLKADAGGGGKGMRIVTDMSTFEENINACKREALSSFKSELILMERYVQKARHVEFQIFADSHGNCIHLFERDCSVQRRHQKVLEESPAPHLDPKLREEMGRAAVQAAKAVGYQGAGTVEFMLDANDPKKGFYFMEMNTRLQVEHPVTEMVTGLDLVEWQLLVASGFPLPIKHQKDVKLHGHAIEARVYAENTTQKLFLPGSGPVRHLIEPKTDVSTRVETGVRQGDVVSIYYDPMIAKLVVHGENRMAAIRKMVSKLIEYRIAGLPTNLDFIHRCILHPEFIHGGVTTNFIETHLHELIPKAHGQTEFLGYESQSEADLLSFIALGHRALFDHCDSNEDSSFSLFRVGMLGYESAFEKFSLQGPNRAKTSFEARMQRHDADPGWIHVSEFTSQGRTVCNQSKFRRRGDVIDVVFNGVHIAGIQVLSVKHPSSTTLYIFSEGKLPRLVYQIEQVIPVYANTKAKKGLGPVASMSIVSPMPGKIVKVLVKDGDDVQANQVLVVMEAMKMEHSLRAPRNAKVKSVLVKAGALVGDQVDVCLLE